MEKISTAEAEPVRLLSAAGHQPPPWFAAALAAAGRTSRARQGQMVIAAGAGSMDVFVVLAGTVRATQFSADGREVVMRDYGAGGFFGELTAVDGERRSVSAVAVSECRLLVVPGPSFRRLVTETPEPAAWFAGHLVAQVRSLTTRVLELSTLTVRTRLHSHLLRLATGAGIAGNRAVIDPIPTHEVLATMIGTRREAVTREISSLAASGIVGKGGRRLHINDVQRLSQLVQDAAGDGAPALSLV